ncbi:MAG: hypothetical protein ACHQAX_10030 [Gammaproteobacteria bacterium]
MLTANQIDRIVEAVYHRQKSPMFNVETNEEAEQLAANLRLEGLKVEIKGKHYSDPIV